MSQADGSSADIHAPQPGVPAFSYVGVPSGQNYEMWREEFCRRFCQLDAEPNTAERIECTVEVTRVATLSFGAAHGTSCSFLRTRPLLSDGCDDLVLVTATEGDVLTVQHGRTVELRQEQMSLMALDDIAECALSDGGRFTALRIPRRELTSICRQAEDKLSKPLVGNVRLRNVISGYYALCAESAASLDAVGQSAMARHMTELVALLLRSDPNDEPAALVDGHNEARLQLIKAKTLKRLSDIELTIASVARQSGLTPKQVQRLFGTTDSTFSEFVLEQRLLMAYRFLSGTQGSREKISTVAHNAGFGDVSYFNRRFRKRFDMTPSEWRDAQPNDS
ncbi:MAG: AraC family transcriptional regulator [Rudaea sp.]